MDLITRLQNYFGTLVTGSQPENGPILVPMGTSFATALPNADPTLFIQMPILACTPTTFVLAPDVPQLAFTILSSHSPVADVRANLDTNARGFDPAAPPVSDTEAAAFRADLPTSRAITATLDGRPVAAGMFTPPIDRITELVGITTLQAYRQRGIGAALTSELVRVAFSQNVDTAILRTDNSVAERLYQRIGFQPVATLIVKQDPESTGV